MTDPGRACPHENFAADVGVQRLTSVEGGPVTAFYAEVRLRCVDCDEPFVFRAPIGLSPQQPRTDVGGLELRAPCRPESYPADWGLDHHPGFGVRVR